MAHTTKEVDIDLYNNLLEAKSVLELYLGDTSTGAWLAARKAVLDSFPKPYAPLLNDKQTMNGRAAHAGVIKNRRLMLVDGLVALHDLMLDEGRDGSAARIKDVIEAERKHANS